MNFLIGYVKSQEKKNALGLYKFNIPNTQSIYLHDTSYPVLFNKHERALSSGCVRVLESKSLALALLQYSGRSESQFNMFSRSKKTRTIRLNKSKKVPVEIIYQSAWINDDGEVNYRFDIYEYDREQQNKVSLISAYNNN
ncbi:L,D-transpeptidase family protein [Photobacterium kishitanii]|uniref:L,D-transpeptidase family protein n=1 Tax=Photobacterium kishitanii TaxID=318456 RepID=UPI0009B97433|nr:L,D-transpeptidase family protein [Photobacterium kishitanii]